jgi:anti-sigma B factor antagonist
VRPDADFSKPRTEHASWTGGSDGLADPLSMLVSRTHGQIVVHLKGELDMATAPALAACLERLRPTRPDTVVVDVSRLDFCDSSGLNVLIRFNRRAQHEGVRLALRAPSGALRRLLQLTHLDDLVEAPDATTLRAVPPEVDQDATEHQ